MDEWLCKACSCAESVHVPCADSARMGASYWHYTVNELGMEDVAAQIDHIHVVKCSELRGGHAGACPCVLAAHKLMQPGSSLIEITFALEHRMHVMRSCATCRGVKCSLTGMMLTTSGFAHAGLVAGPLAQGFRRQAAADAALTKAGSLGHRRSSRYSFWHFPSQALR